jgi:SPP1 family predicted phage head-tail adaptor
MITDPGQLSEKVQVLAPAITYGSNGEPLNTWGDYGTRWAKIEPLGGVETVQADILMPATRARFTLRYDSNYTENHRLVWNEQTWSIINISFEGKNLYTVFLAETNTTQTGDSTSYGNFYATNSLKVRSITGVLVTTLTPSQAQITSDVGMTAPVAGAGYICMITIPLLLEVIQVFSDGTNWYYSYVT